jgi:hypothetical protein
MELLSKLLKIRNFFLKIKFSIIFQRIFDLILLKDGNINIANPLAFKATHNLAPLKSVDYH